MNNCTDFIFYFSINIKQTNGLFRQKEQFSALHTWLILGRVSPLILCHNSRIPWQIHFSISLQLQGCSQDQQLVGAGEVGGS